MLVFANDMILLISSCDTAHDLLDNFIQLAQQLDIIILRE